MYGVMKSVASTSPTVSITGSRECPLYELLNGAIPSCFREDAGEERFVDLIARNPKLCGAIYPFETIGGGPEAIVDGTYPLHRICALGASLAAVRLCHRAHPEAVDAVSVHKGLSCLHYAVLYNRASLDVVQYLLKKMSGMSAGSLGSSVSSSLAYPALGPLDSLGSLDGPLDSLVTYKKQTPLHLACMVCPFASWSQPGSSKVHSYSYNPQVVMILTELGPRHWGTDVDVHGRTPLHVACGVTPYPSLEVVEDLTEVFPDACLVQCHDHRATPLHIACSNAYIHLDEDESAVDFNDDENANRFSDNNNSINNLSDKPKNDFVNGTVAASSIVGVVRDLLRTKPEATQLKDAYGRIPIVVAVENKATFKVCKMLVRKYPACLTQQHPKAGSKDSETLYQLAKRLNLPSETLKLLDQ